MPEDELSIRDVGIAKLQEIARAYRARDLLIRDRKLLTFGTQIMDAVVRLREDDALRESLRARYRYILVDEFQDTTLRSSNCCGSWVVTALTGLSAIIASDYPLPRRVLRSFTDFLDRFAAGSRTVRDGLCGRSRSTTVGRTHPARRGPGDPPQ